MKTKNNISLLLMLLIAGLATNITMIGGEQKLHLITGGILLAYALGLSLYINSKLLAPLARFLTENCPEGTYDLDSLIKEANGKNKLSPKMQEECKETSEKIEHDNSNKNEQPVTEEDRKNKEQAINNLQARIDSILHTISSSSAELNKTSEVMMTVIAKTTDKATSAASESQVTSMNVQTIASAIEEMSSSTKEVAERISKSSLIVKDTVNIVDQADKTSEILKAANDKIASIIQLIQDIAGQINLLALNATIESARAGEAGKGFAVVANEVKTLASQTGKATEDISKQVHSIQTISSQFIDAFKAIKTAISNINEYSTAIAEASEEQSATSTEIASSMFKAATGATHITDDIKQVIEVSNEAQTSARNVMEAAKLVFTETEHLSNEMKLFIEEATR